jgi:hypothetical protein
MAKSIELNTHKICMSSHPVSLVWESVKPRFWAWRAARHSALVVGMFGVDACQSNMPINLKKYYCVFFFNPMSF